MPVCEALAQQPGEQSGRGNSGQGVEQLASNSAMHGDSTGGIKIVALPVNPGGAIGALTARATGSGAGVIPRSVSFAKLEPDCCGWAN